MPVTVEQNIAIKKAIRNDLRYIIPGVPMRYFYRRGPWRPKSALPVEYITEAGPLPEPEPLVPVVPEEPVVAYAKIDIATAASHTIILGAVGRRIRIFFLTFTVAGDVNVTLYDGAETITGAMDFGGVSEPRGVVMPPDGKYLECDTGNNFKILLSAAVQTSGLCLYSYV